MGHELNIVQLEAAINRCKVAEPFSNCILPGDLRKMAEVYGEMIFRKFNSIDLTTQPTLVQEVFGKWLEPVVGASEPIVGMSCSSSAGIPGLDECETCQ